MNIEDTLAQSLQKSFDEHHINDSFQLSNVGYYKLCSWIAEHLMNPLSAQEVSSIKTDRKESYSPNVLARFIYSILICLQFALNTFLYSSYVIIMHTINRLPRLDRQNKDKNIKVVFVTAPREIPRFTLLENITGDEMAIGFLPNLNISVFQKMNQEKDAPPMKWVFFAPSVISLKILSQAFGYAFQQGPGIHAHVAHMFNGDHGKAFFVHDKIFKFMVLNLSAQKNAQYCQQNYPNAVFTFDNDSAINSISLVEKLNERKCKTLHLQHGTNAKLNNYCYTPPLCQYMLCCSQRDIEEQVNTGVDQSRLFQLGAPLQSLSKVSDEKKEKTPTFDIAILATVGPDRIQEKSIELLKQYFSSTNAEQSILLRHHPRATSEERHAWQQAIGKHTISQPPRSLEDDIAAGKILITFSIDAFVTCLRHHTKVIFCPQREEFYNNVAFLDQQPFIKMADTPIELGSSIEELSQIKNSDYEKLYDEDFLNKNFGSNDLSTIKLNIKQAISTISAEGTR